MDYRDILSEVFEGNGPSSLRILFDNGSSEWQNVTTAKKVWFLERMVLSKYPIEYWVNEYTKQYLSSHKHIISAIKPSLEFLLNHIENQNAKEQIKIWLENNKI